MVTFLQNPTTPIPDDVIDTIAAYLRNNQKYDHVAAERLQEELLAIFESHVKGNPEAGVPWIGLLRRLLPVIQTVDRIMIWFDRCKGIMDTIAHNKGALEEVLAAFMDLITVAEEYHVESDNGSTPNPFIDKLFFVWMSKFHPAYSAGVSGMENNERIVREALNQFGKKRPQVSQLSWTILTLESCRLEEETDIVIELVSLPR